MSVSGVVNNVFVYKSSFNVAAPLSICTVAEQRALIGCGHQAFISTSEIYRRMFEQCDEHCVAQNGALMFHEKACPHSAAATFEAIKQLKIFILVINQLDA